MRIRIATRESGLAMWQANHVKALIEATSPDANVEIVGMTTEGDRNKRDPLSRMGGKGVFVKELEVALLAGDVEIAVHSMKDVPAQLPDGLCIDAVCPREVPTDAMVSNQWATLADLPAGSRVGTSSLRRKIQLARHFPLLEFRELRGNVDTRLRKLDEGEYDAIILASAGLIRMGWRERIAESISPDICVPAAGQGAVGIECATAAEDVRAVLARINDPIAAARVQAERTVSAGLGANCTSPIAAYSTVQDGHATVTAFVSDVAGSRMLDVRREGPADRLQHLAEAVVSELVAKGARDLVESA